MNCGKIFMRRRQKCRQKQLGGERTLLATANATSRMGQGLIAQKANLQKNAARAANRGNGSLFCAKQSENDTFTGVKTAERQNTKQRSLQTVDKAKAAKSDTRSTAIARFTEPLRHPSALRSGKLRRFCHLYAP